MNRVMKSLSAEFRKVRATKMWWILALVMFLFTAFMGGIFAAMFGFMADEMGTGAAAAGMSPVAMGKMVLSSVSGFAYAVPLLLGAIMATGELRHKILGLAFIAEPHRGIVLGSKLVVLLAVGALLGAVGLIAAGGAAALLLPDGWVAAETVLVGLRTVVAIALWAVIGFGVGLLVRNQAITIVLVLVFTQFLEPTLRTAAMLWEPSAQIAKFLPGSASDGFVGASILGDLGELDPSMGETASTTFGVLPAFVCLLAYAVLSVCGGWLLRWRGDVE